MLVYQRVGSMENHKNRCFNHWDSKPEMWNRHTTAIHQYHSLHASLALVVFKNFDLVMYILSVPILTSKNGEYHDIMLGGAAVH